LASFHNVDCDIVVVDNHSSDDTCEIVARKFPHVKIIDTGANYGFAHGINTIIENAASPFVVLLNADVRVTKDDLEKTLSFMRDHRDCAIASPITYDADGQREYNVRRYPGLVTATSEAILGGAISRKLGMSEMLAKNYYWRYLGSKVHCGVYGEMHLLTSE
jgi:GT2 family glycosyltransferase